MRYVSVRVMDAEDAASAPTVFACATTAFDNDLRLGNEASLTAADAERLISKITRRAPAALQGAFLSDAGGELLVLEPTELRIGSRRSTYARRSNSSGGFLAASVCQATWIRQGGIEVVLVAPSTDCSCFLFGGRSIVRLARCVRRRRRRERRTRGVSEGVC